MSAAVEQVQEEKLESTPAPEGPPPFFAHPRRWLTDYGTHLALFSRNARLFLFGSFFMGLGFSVFQVLLNLYFKELGFRESTIGDILSVGALGSVLIAGPAAILLSRRDAKPFLVVTAVLAGLTYSLQATVVQKAGLLAASLGTGMMVSVFRVAAAPFFMRNSTQKERTYLFSVNFGIGTLAGFVGSLLGGWLPAVFSSFDSSIIHSHRWALVSGAGLTLLAAIPFALLRPQAPVSGQSGQKLAWHLLKKKGGLYFKLCFPFLILGLGAGLVIPFLNLYFKTRFQQSSGEIGTFFAILSFATLAGVLTGPVLTRKWGMVRTIVWTQFISIPFMLILAFTYFLPLAVVAFLFRGALMNLGQPIAVHFTMEQVAPEEHALANSLLMLAWAGAWVVSTNLGGKLIARYGFTPPLLVTVGLYIVSSVLYYLYFAHAEKVPKAVEAVPVPEAVG